MTDYCSTMQAEDVSLILSLRFHCVHEYFRCCAHMYNNMCTSHGTCIQEYMYVIGLEKRGRFLCFFFIMHQHNFYNIIIGCHPWAWNQVLLLLCCQIRTTHFCMRMAIMNIAGSQCLWVMIHVAWKLVFCEKSTQSARRGTIFIQNGSESCMRKSCSLYGSFVWGNFNMAAETASQLKRALHVNNVGTNAFKPRTS